MWCGKARREASLRHCGRNLSISGWGGGGLGGKPAYGTAVGIFPSPMGWGRARGEASLRHCGRNFYVSGWGGGGLEGKSSLRHCGRIFLHLKGRKKDAGTGEEH